MRVKNQRLSQEELILIRRLTNEGKSLNYLSNLIGVGKPTIYYQVRKFKPRIKKDFVVNLNDFQIGELIGAFAGDGTYYHSKSDRRSHHKIRYCLSSLTDIPYAKHLMQLLKGMGLNPYIIKKKDGNSIELTINSKSFIEFIKEYLKWDNDKTFSVRLRPLIDSYSDEFLKGFARGLMDTDGFLNPGNAVCACISKELIDNLDSIFRRFGMEVTRKSLKRGGNRRELFFVRVRRKSLLQYSRVIGFSNTYKKKRLMRLLGKDLKED